MTIIGFSDEVKLPPVEITPAEDTPAEDTPVEDTPDKNASTAAGSKKKTKE